MWLKLGWTHIIISTIIIDGKNFKSGIEINETHKNENDDNNDDNDKNQKIQGDFDELTARFNALK